MEPAAAERLGGRLRAEQSVDLTRAHAQRDRVIRSQRPAVNLGDTPAARKLQSAADCSACAASMLTAMPACLTATH